jgi:hypothetical protein
VVVVQVVVFDPGIITEVELKVVISVKAVNSSAVFTT